ncbi:hypothetical protein [Actinobacillus porcinus]|uniref:hypothetical protein n=1 Tax=Actinobacillus porcinus TaxID=51048 RepID=UPI002A912381|nr:hypothetical protein [Actinobacillus porcinus]MDY6215642.1 hypothetical protein [Actinobacillus porcinus]
MRYYELNPQSPYFPYMQDTSVEDMLSEDEKDSLYRTQLAGILFSMFEGAEFTEDEKNFMIYATINDLEPRNSFNIMRKVEGLSEIDFTEVDRRKKEILHTV